MVESERKCLFELLAQDEELYDRMLYLFKEIYRKDFLVLEKTKEEGLKKPLKYVPKLVVLSGASAKIQEFANKYKIEPNGVLLAFGIFSEGVDLPRYLKGREESERRKKGY
jgi:hypothetical protein